MSVYPFRDLMQSQVSHINQQNMLTISKSNLYHNILETMIYYNPFINSTRPCIGHTKVQYSNNKERNDRVNKVITKCKAWRWNFPWKLRTYPTWMKRRIQDFNNIAFQIIKRPEPKIFGTRKENGVSTPYLLSMRSYAHTQEKHD